MNSPTKLFTKEQVKKFFSILNKLSDGIPVDKTNYPWKDYQTIYTKESNHIPTTREVFTHRTINKWLKNKYLIIYRVSDLEITYKQYVSITKCAYLNDWGSGYINVGLLDYSRPFDSTLFGGKKIKYNDATALEGEWCENGKLHHDLLSMITIEDVPYKEYIFNAYDWNKYPKRVKKGTDPKDLMRTTVSFNAKTEHKAYELKNKYEQENDKFYIGELIEVKEMDQLVIKNFV
jgi:hypothetical protein